MSIPKREPSVLERIPKSVASEVWALKEKKDFATFYEALEFHILANKNWKKAETERKKKIQNDTRKECEDRHRHIDESHVRQIAKLEIDLKASNSKVIEKNSENEKLKWKVKANADIARDEIVQKDAEITQKESEIAKLNVEREKGPSSQIMKENSEMKETIQSLESQVNELKNKARVPVWDERL